MKRLNPKQKRRLIEIVREKPCSEEFANKLEIQDKKRRKLSSEQYMGGGGRLPYPFR